MRTSRSTALTALIAALALTALARPAGADVTLFVGANTSPGPRALRGIAGGIGLLVVGVEGEYASTVDAPTATTPGSTTATLSGLLQTPGGVLAGIQPYVSGGVGLYQEHRGVTSAYAAGTAVGGGAKVRLLGPVRLRVDYRAFRRRSGVDVRVTHRVYAGVNVAF